MALFTRRLAAALAITMSVLLLGACVSAAGDGSSDTQLSIVGFAVPEAANRAIAEEFATTEAGEGVAFSGSYGASGDQSRKVAAGADADYVHFSLEGDVTRLVEAGLVAKDWKDGPNQGIVSSSIVVFVVPEGNPDNIRDWDDLLRDEVDVITPDPDSSGSARWNILAGWGAQIAAGKSEAEAEEYLAGMFENVTQWAGSGREATEAFANKIGNVLISYENEAILARQKGEKYEYVIPETTLLIENPGTVLKGADPKAEDWLDFVLGETGQAEFAKSGFRPVIPGIDVQVDGALDPSDPFPEPKRLLTIADDFGGWEATNKKFFDDGGLIGKLRKAAAGQ